MAYSFPNNLAFEYTHSSSQSSSPVCKAIYFTFEIPIEKYLEFFDAF